MMRAAPEDNGGFLTDLWYFAALSRDLKKGALTRRIFFGEPIVLGRTPAGDAFALRDVCPHRAAPLSAGRIASEGGEPVVECPYHGWRFRSRDGVCAAIPALTSDASYDVSKISVRRFALHEANGIIWLYWAEGGGGAPSTPPPEIGIPASWRPRVSVRVAAEGPFDETVIGLVDPAHTPFVHRQWWWREGAGLKDKHKNFVPTALGFKMPAHPPSSNSRIYHFLGGAPTTEIEFRLPGVRLETIRVGKRTILGLTCMTPIGPGRTDITHLIYWDLPMLTLATPVAQRMAENFLAQDGAILRAQNENLSRRDHRPLYVGDPDEPAKWYLRLKRAWVSRPPGGVFDNPIKEGSLRWRT